MDNGLFVNVGSVGKPTDGDWRACYAIVEPSAKDAVAFVRVAYDLNRVVEAIRRSELPDEFAADLERGGAVVTTHQ